MNIASIFKIFFKVLFKNTGVFLDKTMKPRSNEVKLSSYVDYRLFVEKPYEAEILIRNIDTQLKLIRFLRSSRFISLFDNNKMYLPSKRKRKCISTHSTLYFPFLTYFKIQEHKKTYFFLSFQQLKKFMNKKLENNTGISSDGIQIEQLLSATKRI